MGLIVAVWNVSVAALPAESRGNSQVGAIPSS